MQPNGAVPWKQVAIGTITLTLTLVGVIWALVIGRLEKLEAQGLSREARIVVLERDLFGIKVELGNLLDAVERIENKLDKALGTD